MLCEECLYQFFFISLSNPFQRTLNFLTEEPWIPSRAQKQQKYSLNSCILFRMVLDGSNQVEEAFIYLKIYHSSQINTIHFKGPSIVYLHPLGPPKDPQKSQKYLFYSPIFPSVVLDSHNHITKTKILSKYVFSLSFTSQGILNIMYKAPGALNRTQIQPTIPPMLPYFL